MDEVGLGRTRKGESSPCRLNRRCLRHDYGLEQLRPVRCKVTKAAIRGAPTLQQIARDGIEPLSWPEDKRGHVHEKKFMYRLQTRCGAM